MNSLFFEEQILLKESKNKILLSQYDFKKRGLQDVFSVCDVRVHHVDGHAQNARCPSELGPDVQEVHHYLVVEAGPMLDVVAHIIAAEIHVISLLSPHGHHLSAVPERGGLTH